MDKKSPSERDICTKLITPALEAASQDRSSQFLEEVNLTSGRVVVRGNKAKRDEKNIHRADYVLYHKPGIPIAVVEAIAKGPRRRVLLVMATGTGKAYTVFQVIWRLWKSRARHMQA